MFDKPTWEIPTRAPPRNAAFPTKELLLSLTTHTVSDHEDTQTRNPNMSARVTPNRNAPKSHRQLARPPFECIALLLQGGGALGAYQAGVYEALSEAHLARGLSRHGSHLATSRGARTTR